MTTVHTKISNLYEDFVNGVYINLTKEFCPHKFEITRSWLSDSALKMKDPRKKETLRFLLVKRGDKHRKLPSNPSIKLNFVTIQSSRVFIVF